MFVDHYDTMVTSIKEMEKNCCWIFFSDQHHNHNQKNPIAMMERKKIVKIFTT